MHIIHAAITITQKMVIRESTAKTVSSGAFFGAHTFDQSYCGVKVSYVTTSTEVKAPVTLESPITQSHDGLGYSGEQR